MRPLELLGKILAEGYHAEIKDISNGLLLIIKPQHPLSRFVGQLIKNEGFKFRYSYNEKNGNAVMIFYKNIDSTAMH
jgi:hypothetical protein